MICKLYVHRALNKKLRAEELLKISKLPPSMAKREVVNKKKIDVLEDFEAAPSETPDLSKSVDIIPSKTTSMMKKSKKQSRRKPKRSKSALTTPVQSKYRNVEHQRSNKTSIIDSRAVSWNKFVQYDRFLIIFSPKLWIVWHHGNRQNFIKKSRSSRRK